MKLNAQFIEDKDQANALAHEITTLASKQALEINKAQLEVNKVEAAHKSLFVAGWRPFCGWISALGLAYNVIIAQILGGLDLRNWSFIQCDPGPGAWHLV